MNIDIVRDSFFFSQRYSILAFLYGVSKSFFTVGDQPRLFLLQSIFLSKEKMGVPYR